MVRLWIISIRYSHSYSRKNKKTNWLIEQLKYLGLFQTMIHWKIVSVASIKVVNIVKQTLRNNISTQGMLLKVLLDKIAFCVKVDIRHI